MKEESVTLYVGMAYNNKGNISLSINEHTDRTRPDVDGSMGFFLAADPAKEDWSVLEKGAWEKLCSIIPEESDPWIAAHKNRRLRARLVLVLEVPDEA